MERAQAWETNGLVNTVTAAKRTAAVPEASRPSRATTAAQAAVTPRVDAGRDKVKAVHRVVEDGHPHTGSHYHGQTGGEKDDGDHVTQRRSHPALQKAGESQSTPRRHHSQDRTERGEGRLREADRQEQQDQRLDRSGEPEGH